MPWIHTDNPDFKSYYEIPRLIAACDIHLTDIEKVKERRKYFGQHNELFQRLAKELRDKYFSLEASWNLKNYRASDFVIKWYEGKAKTDIMTKEIAPYCDQQFYMLIA